MKCQREALLSRDARSGTRPLNIEQRNTRRSVLARLRETAVACSVRCLTRGVTSKAPAPLFLRLRETSASLLRGRVVGAETSAGPHCSTASRARGGSRLEEGPRLRQQIGLLVRPPLREDGALLYVCRSDSRVSDSRVSPSSCRDASGPSVRSRFRSTRALTVGGIDDTVLTAAESTPVPHPMRRLRRRDRRAPRGRRGMHVDLVSVGIFSTPTSRSKARKPPPKSAGKAHEGFTCLSAHGQIYPVHVHDLRRARTPSCEPARCRVAVRGKA